jgi:hypothetical protein
MSTTFDAWVNAVFDHPTHRPQWYWDHDFHAFWDRLETSDKVTIEHLNRLFLNSGILESYSREQVAQGIWFVLGESSPARSAYAFLNRDVALAERNRCVRSMVQFFSDFVAAIAPDVANTQTDPLHIACWMWWDMFPTRGGDEVEPELRESSLDTMAAMLTLPQELCQLSALHGLNHWYVNHPERVRAIVDSFLDRAVSLTSRVMDYAATARSGLGQ